MGTITSTTTGGNWSAGGTWVGGVAPISTDDAVIATTGTNTVVVDGVTTINKVTINSGAILDQQNALTINQTSSTCFINNGTFYNKAALTLGSTPANYDALTGNGQFIIPTTITAGFTNTFRGAIAISGNNTKLQIFDKNTVCTYDIVFEFDFSASKLCSIQGTIIINGEAKSSLFWFGADAAVGATSLTLSASPTAQTSPTGWANGDELFVNSWTVGASASIEKLSVTSVSGGTIGVSGTGAGGGVKYKKVSHLDHAHGQYGINITKKVRFRNKQVSDSNNARYTEIQWTPVFATDEFWGKNFSLEYMGYSQGGLYINPSTVDAGVVAEDIVSFYKTTAALRSQAFFGLNIGDTASASTNPISVKNIGIVGANTSCTLTVTQGNRSVFYLGEVMGLGRINGQTAVTATPLYLTLNKIHTSLGKFYQAGVNAQMALSAGLPSGVTGPSYFVDTINIQNSGGAWLTESMGGITNPTASNPLPITNKTIKNFKRYLSNTQGVRIDAGVWIENYEDLGCSAMWGSGAVAFTLDNLTCGKLVHGADTINVGSNYSRIPAPTLSYTVFSSRSFKVGSATTVLLTFLEFGSPYHRGFINSSDIPVSTNGSSVGTDFYQFYRRFVSEYGSLDGCAVGKLAGVANCNYWAAPAGQMWSLAYGSKTGHGDGDGGYYDGVVVSPANLATGDSNALPVGFSLWVPVDTDSKTIDLYIAKSVSGFDGKLEISMGYFNTGTDVTPQKLVSGTDFNFTTYDGTDSGWTKVSISVGGRNTNGMEQISFKAWDGATTGDILICADGWSWRDGRPNGLYPSTGGGGTTLIVRRGGAFSGGMD